MDYAAIYTPDFFRKADGIAEWNNRKIKYGDALAAIGYSLGLSSIEELRSVVPFVGVGRETPDDRLTAADQVSRVVSVATRQPRGVLEIGCGRGEVSVSLAHAGHAVQAIEPCVGALAWITETARHFFAQELADLPIRLLNGPAHAVIDGVDWSMVDTVVMVESLEHILAEDFSTVYDRIRDGLRASRGRFIVTNWIDYHPIDVGWAAGSDVHCRRVDDALYDSWSQDSRSVVYRNGSHLVLDY